MPFLLYGLVWDLSISLVQPGGICTLGSGRG